MRLRDGTKWFSEIFWRFFALFGKFDLSKEEAEKRERLVQTYLVIFGLLLSSGGDHDLQADLMKFFIAFLLASLIYYSMLTRSVGSKHVRNLFALIMAYSFSSAFVSCYVAFAGHLMGMWLLFLIIVYYVALPLFV